MDGYFHFQEDVMVSGVRAGGEMERYEEILCLVKAENDEIEKKEAR